MNGPQVLLLIAIFANVTLSIPIYGNKFTTRIGLGFPVGLRYNAFLRPPPMLGWGFHGYGNIMNGYFGGGRYLKGGKIYGYGKVFGGYGIRKIRGYGYGKVFGGYGYGQPLRGYGYGGMFGGYGQPLAGYVYGGMFGGNGFGNTVGGQLGNFGFGGFGDIDRDDD